MTDAARRGLETPEDEAARVVAVWEDAEGECMCEGHRATMEQGIAAAIRARDQAVLEQAIRLVDDDCCEGECFSALCAFARELAEEKA